MRSSLSTTLAGALRQTPFRSYAMSASRTGTPLRPFEIARRIRAIEASMTGVLDLRAVAIPEQLARRHDGRPGRDAVIETHAFAGGPLAFARFTTLVEGGLE